MIFEVIYEYEEDGKIVDLFEYVEADDFESVALDSIEFAKNYDKEVKSIRYLFNVVKRIKKEEET